MFSIPKVEVTWREGRKLQVTQDGVRLGASDVEQRGLCRNGSARESSSGENKAFDTMEARKVGTADRTAGWAHAMKVKRDVRS